MCLTLWMRQGYIYPWCLLPVSANGVFIHIHYTRGPYHAQEVSGNCRGHTFSLTSLYMRAGRGGATLWFGQGLPNTKLFLKRRNQTTSLKTEVLPSDNLKIGWICRAVGKQVGKSAPLQSAGKLRAYPHVNGFKQVQITYLAVISY